MKRSGLWIFALALLIGGVGVQQGAAAPPIDSYCSPTGAYCLEVETANNRTYLNIKAKDLTGRYELCIKGRGLKDCKAFKLHKTGNGSADSVELDRQFDRPEPGRYSATWKLDGRKLGERLHFVQA